VVGGCVGEGVGKFVGLHVVQESVKSFRIPDVCPSWKTAQDVCASGGVLLHLLPSTPNAAIAPESPAITQLSACSSYPQ